MLLHASLEKNASPASDVKGGSQCVFARPVHSWSQVLRHWPPARQAPYTNIAGIVVEFPSGAISFADAVVDSPGLVADPDRFPTR